MAARKKSKRKGGKGRRKKTGRRKRKGSGGEMPLKVLEKNAKKLHKILAERGGTEYIKDD